MTDKGRPILHVNWPQMTVPGSAIDPDGIEWCECGSPPDPHLHFDPPRLVLCDPQPKTIQGASQQDPNTWGRGEVS